MQPRSGEREYQLRSVDQAQMDYWVSQLRDCYREMTSVAMRAIQREGGKDTEFGQPLGEYAGEDAQSLCDEEVVWPFDAEKELCYRKDGGQVVVRSRTKGSLI